MKIIISEVISSNPSEDIRAEIDIQDNSNIAIVKLEGDRNLLFEIRLTDSNYIEAIRQRLNEMSLDFDYYKVLEII